MPPLGPAIEVVGITIVGLGPIGVIHLEWSDGVWAFYGRNGSGKTALLRGVAAAWSGGVDQGEAWLHLRFTDPAETVDWGEIGRPREGLENVLLAMLHSSLQGVVFRPESLLGPKDLAEALMAEFEGVMVEGTPQVATEKLLGSLDVPFLDTSTHRDISTQGYLSLRAAGREDDPSWEVFISASVGRSSGPVIQLFSRAQDLGTVWDQAVGALGDTDADHSGADEEGLRAGLIDAMSAFVGEEASDDDVFELLESPFFNILRWRDPPPAWVPIPIAGPLKAFGQDTLDVRKSLPLVVRERPDVDLNAATVAWLYDTEAVTELEVFLVSSSSARTSTLELTQQANEILDRLLEDAPLLRLSVLHERNWLAGDFVRWEALDRAFFPDERWVSLEDISQAQRRWARFAIELAMTTHSDRSAIVFLDQPEDALHSAAIRRVLEGFHIVAGNDTTVVTATHAPAFLNDRRSRLIHVFRNSEGWTEARPMSRSYREGLDSVAEELGLSPAEALQLTRLFLVVEGERDVRMLRGFFGQQLDEERIRILAMRGSRNLESVVDSQLVFDFTEASLLAAVDSSRIGKVAPAWSQARSLINEGNRPAAHKSIRALRDEGLTDEEKSIVEFLDRAIAVRRENRVTVIPLGEPDGIYYLPVERFVPAATSWADVRREYQRTRHRRGDGHEDIKTWLKREHGADVSPEAFETAAQSADAIPPDIARLWGTALELAGHSG